jgi:PleD family two-component response regulator
LSERARVAEGTTAAAPLVLIVDGQEWSARALESILLPAGYRVHRALTTAGALADAVAHTPDAILIDLGADQAGIELCRQLVATPRVGPATPLVVTSSDLDARLLRLDALEAGAWEFLTLPPAVDELLARLHTWIRAKRVVDAVREASLIDVETGFYNVRGLEKRASELAAEAARFRRPLSCVVFTLDVGAVAGSADSPREFFEQVRAALSETIRTCDTVGRLSARQFAVLAPATEPSGAQRLAERVLEAVDRLRAVHGPTARQPIYAGYYGVPDLSAAVLEPGDFIARAASAGGSTADGVLRIRAYDSATYN